MTTYLLRASLAVFLLLLSFEVATANPQRKAHLVQVKAKLEAGSSPFNYIKTKIAPTASHRDAELIYQLLKLDHIRITNSLLRFVFPKLVGKGAHYDALLGAARIPEHSERYTYLKKLRKKWDDKKALKKMTDPITFPEAPKGFSWSKPFLGVGKYSWVVQLTRDSDGAKFAWKLKTGTKTKDGSDTANIKSINLYILLRELGVTNAEIFYDEVSGTLLHEFVEGPTLQKAMAKEDFMVDRKHPMNIALRKLVEKMIKKHIIIYDINTKNMVYEGKRWDVIDSQKPRMYDSALETFERWRTYTLLDEGKWVNSNNRLPVDSVAKFWKIFEQENLPALIKNDKAPSKKIQRLVADVLAYNENGVFLESALDEGLCSKYFRSALKGSK